MRPSKPRRRSVPRLPPRRSAPAPTVTNVGRSCLCFLAVHARLSPRSSQVDVDGACFDPDRIGGLAAVTSSPRISGLRSNCHWWPGQITLPCNNVASPAGGLGGSGYPAKAYTCPPPRTVRWPNARRLRPAACGGRPSSLVLATWHDPWCMALLLSAEAAGEDQTDAIQVGAT